MTTATQTQIRRDTATNLSAATPAEGELGYDKTNKRLAVGDGATAGGIKIPNSKDAQNNVFTAADAGGSADAYTLTLSPVPAAYVKYMSFRFTAGFTNTTTTPTINLNSLGAKTMKKKTSSGVAALGIGDIQSGGVYIGTYDGTYVQIEGGSAAGVTTKLLRSRYLPVGGSSYTPGADVSAFYVFVSGAIGAQKNTGTLGANGGAGYAEKYYSSPAGPYSYGIGAAGSISTGSAGGTTTFDTISITGSAGTTTTAGSAGGVASGGDFNANGGSGGSTSTGGGVRGGGPGAGGSRAGNGGNGGGTNTGAGGGTGGNATLATAGIAATVVSGSALTLPYGQQSETFGAGTAGFAPGSGGTGVGGPAASGNDTLDLLFGLTSVIGGQPGIGGGAIAGSAGLAGIIQIVEILK